MFRGRYEHSMDAKGRTAVPARYRDALSAGGDDKLVLTTSLDSCVVAYPMREWIAGALIVMIAVGCSDESSPPSTGQSTSGDTMDVDVRGYYFGVHVDSVPEDCRDPIGRDAAGTTFTIIEMMDEGRTEGDVLATGEFEAPSLGEYQGNAACVLEGGSFTVPRVEYVSVGTEERFLTVATDDLEAEGGVAWVDLQP